MRKVFLGSCKSEGLNSRTLGKLKMKSSKTRLLPLCAQKRISIISFCRSLAFGHPRWAGSNIDCCDKKGRRMDGVWQIPVPEEAVALLREFVPLVLPCCTYLLFVLLLTIPNDPSLGFSAMRWNHMEPKDAEPSQLKASQSEFVRMV